MLGETVEFDFLKNFDHGLIFRADKTQWATVTIFIVDFGINRTLIMVWCLGQNKPVTENLFKVSN